MPLSAPALEAPREIGKVRNLLDDLIFLGSRGKPRFPTVEWKAALAVAELEDFRFHDLRHTAASYLAMSGATAAELKEILGHKTLTMVSRYTHLMEGHARTLLDRMADRFPL